MLALGSAALPARGMRAIPEQLAARLRKPVPPALAERGASRIDFR